MTVLFDFGERKIIVTKDGPYLAFGGLPLVAKTQIVSEHGEPLAWRKDGEIDTQAHELCQIYSLCRCGHSKDKPFCDSTHQTISFDGTETADPRPMADRQQTFEGEGPLVVKHDDTLCAESGFCGTRNARLCDLVPAAHAADVMVEIIAMVEHCPSGSLTYAPAAGEPQVERRDGGLVEIGRPVPVADRDLHRLLDGFPLALGRLLVRQRRDETQAGDAREEEVGGAARLHEARKAGCRRHRPVRSAIGESIARELGAKEKARLEKRKAAQAR